MNNGLNTFKMNDPTHMQMLIVQEMQKKSLNIFKYKWRGIKLLCVFQYILVSEICNI